MVIIIDRGAHRSKIYESFMDYRLCGAFYLKSHIQFIVIYPGKSDSWDVVGVQVKIGSSVSSVTYTHKNKQTAVHTNVCNKEISQNDKLQN